MTAEQLEETAYLYTLDLLDEDERAEFAGRLERQETDALEALAAAETVADALPEALSPVAPRPEAKQALLARVEGSVQNRPSTTPLRPSARATTPTRSSAPAWAWAALALLTFGLGVALTSTFQRDAASDDSGTIARALVDAEERARLASVERDRLAEELAALERDRATTPEPTPMPVPEATPRPVPAPTPMPAPSSRLAELEADAERLRRDARALETRLAEQSTLAATQEERLRSAETARRDADERLAANQRALDANERALDDAREALALVRAPDVGIVDLFGTEEGTSTSASVFWDRGLTRCYLHARALPPLEDDESYALWLAFESGATLHVDDLEVNERGIGSLLANLPRGHGEVLRTFVTREPPGERTRPSGPVVMAERPSTSDSSVDPRRKYRRRS